MVAPPLCISAGRFLSSRFVRSTLRGQGSLTMSDLALDDMPKKERGWSGRWQGSSLLQRCTNQKRFCSRGSARWHRAGIGGPTEIRRHLSSHFFFCNRTNTRFCRFWAGSDQPQADRCTNLRETTPSGRSSSQTLSAEFSCGNVRKSYIHWEITHVLTCVRCRALAAAPARSLRLLRRLPRPPAASIASLGSRSICDGAARPAATAHRWCCCTFPRHPACWHCSCSGDRAVGGHEGAC